MSQTRRTVILLGMMLAALLGTTAWTAAGLWSAHEQLHEAQTTTTRVHQLADAIKQLREAPARAEAAELGEVEMVRRIEEAAAAAGMTHAQIDRIQPEPPQRIADTVYMAHPTRVTLRQATLSQLVHMLHRLVSESQTFRIDTIRITAPRGQETGPHWRVEFVIQHMVYQPRHTGGTPR